MDAKQIAALRPRDTTPAEIAGAIERGEDALAELRGEKAALQGARRRVVLDGTDQAVERHDARVRAIQNDIERISTTIEETLRPELSIANGNEKLKQIETLRQEAAFAIGRFREFWTTKYEPLALAIAAGLAELETANSAVERTIAAERRAANDPDVNAAGGVPPGDIGWGFWKVISGSDGNPPTMTTCLPAVGDGKAIYWPDGYFLRHARELRRAVSPLAG